LRNCGFKLTILDNLSMRKGHAACCQQQLHEAMQPRAMGDAPMLYNRSILAIASALFLALLAGCKAEDATSNEAEISTRSRSGVEILPQIGHRTSVVAVAVSPDGRFAASAGKAVKLWEVATGREVRSFAGHTYAVTAVTFSPDGRFLVSGGYESSPAMRMWDVATGQQLRSFDSGKDCFDCGVTSIVFTPDGRFILSGHRTTGMRMWDAQTGEVVRTFVGPRSSDGRSNDITSVAISRDGRFALSGKASPGGDAITLWDVATGTKLRGFGGDQGGIPSVAFSPDGRFALSGTGGPYNGGNDWTVRLYRLDTGEQIRSFDRDLQSISSVTFSPDGEFVVAGGYGGNAPSIILWEVSTGKRLRSFSEVPGKPVRAVPKGWLEGPPLGKVSSVAFSPDGRFILAACDDYSVKLWDAADGQKVRSFEGRTLPIDAVAFSPDGRFALIGDEKVHLWETASGKHLRSFDVESVYGGVKAVAFSGEGRFAVAAGNFPTKIWDIATGEEQPGPDPKLFHGAEALSPDGRRVLARGRYSKYEVWDVATQVRLVEGIDGVDATAFSLSNDGRFFLTSGIGLPTVWDTATGKEVSSFGTLDRGFGPCTNVSLSPDGNRALCSRLFSEPLTLWNAHTGRKLRDLTDKGSIGLHLVGFSADSRFVFADRGSGMVMWDAASGRRLARFGGHASWPTSAAVSPDGRLLLSGSNDGTARIWSVATGAEMVRMMATPEGDWLTITPDGFFSSSQRDTDMLTIARGLEFTTVGQIHQSLFNPDLVREALAGDTDGEVARAAKVAGLDKVLDAGPPPTVAIASHRSGSRSATDLVELNARVTDRGKGVGRIEWRVNGVTAGVSGLPAGSGPEREVKRTLALDPGENQIEVIAYEAHNLLASLPARATIVVKAPTDAVKPKLYLLAIGINAYADKGGASPATSGSFPPLSLAVSDAKAFAAEMRKAGAGHYGEVVAVEALDTDAASASLDRTIEQMSARINPRDTFVLFAAAHGISKHGRFYLIPQDYQGGNDPEALASRAISQERLQDWVGNRIKARKAVIFLDTCESGALVSGYTKSRTDAPASEAAIGRLHEATGRPVLTAAASGKPAYEGYKGHGVFTFAVLDGLRHGDSNGNGMIELSELVAYVQGQVPKFSAELGGRGLSTIMIRGFNDDRQSVHFGSTGEDFALVRRLP
jgi:WD40 repeat protein